ncbi:MAG TPA: replication-associated recombination protein A, partial [Microbacteriaceae bacterium]|nr:replication-associated recombination protein A [Microbacteriaceae bacterium]
AIIRLATGDARRALTVLEAASAAAGEAESEAAGTVGRPDDDEAEEAGAAGETAVRPRIVTAELVARTLDRALVRYDKTGDQHYDVTSAFIKSLRGSDVDAALHYLARMIEAGEDPRFIARRLVILASEDVGMADPQALRVAVAAAQAVQLVGMPEGRIPLAQAVIHLAMAPKSNSAYLAIDRAIADVRAGTIGQVPAPLRDSHYAGAAGLGHGAGYRYPHDDPRGVVEQQYLPKRLRGAVYYRPSEHGAEREVALRLPKIRRVVRGEEP